MPPSAPDCSRRSPQPPARVNNNHQRVPPHRGRNTTRRVLEHRDAHATGRLSGRGRADTGECLLGGSSSVFNPAGAPQLLLGGHETLT